MPLHHQRRINRLKRDYNVDELHKLYNIDKYQISLSSIDDVNEKLKIKYYYQYPNINNIKIIKNLLEHNVINYNGIYIPLELSRIIGSYIKEYDFLETNINIYFPSDYPFIPPIWSLINCKTNINSSYNNILLDEFLKYKIKLHNNSLNNSWSAIIHPDKDILIFLTNNIESLNYYINN